MSLRYKGGVISATAPTTTGTTSGTAPGVWTLQQQMQAQGSSLWPVPLPAATNPPFYDVTMLLNGDGTNGAQNNTFLDSSSNAFSITRNGNTTQGSFSPYGSLWGNYFDGSSYLNTISDSNLQIGTNDFTVEFWSYNTGLSGAQQGRGAIFSTQSINTSGSFGIFQDDTSSSGYVIRFGGASDITISPPSLNSWNHIAVTRASNVVKVFKNGVLQASSTISSNVTQSQIYIGRLGSITGYNFYGYISNLRFVNGSSIYNSDFTPSTTPLTAVSGTVLITCQSNRFIDNSSNNYTLTTTGTPSVQRFSPFNPTASYSTATIGGSGYFDGTGDYLVVAGGSSNAYNFGTGNATVEAWVKTTSTGFQVIASNYSSGVPGVTDQWRLLIGQNTAGRVEWTQGSTIVAYNSKLVNDGAWHHVAAVINSGSVIIYVDGVGGSSASLSGYNYTATTDMYVGIYYYGSGVYGPFNGYITNLRINKGTAVYTTNFTPPTSPLTAISGTTALLNFTNAGIPDSAMMNDLETVGNAQVSTSVKKFGTGSLAFDGTGDWLSASSSPNYNFNTGNATIEAWIYPTSVSGTQVFVDMRVGSEAGIALYLNDSTLSVAKDIGTVLQSGGTVPVNTWSHVAWCRSGSTNKLFLNGTVVSTVTDSTNYPNAPVYVGCSADAYQPYTGYIDDLRITKGYAVYTENFAPPAAAFPTY